MLTARLSGNSLIQFPVLEGMEILKRILHNACAISGMGLPTNILIAESLKNNLYNFFLEFGFKILNEEEFNLAFLINTIEQKMTDGTIIPPIENFGEFISVLYCSRILSKYMITRGIFDRKMQNIIDGYDKN